MAEAGKPIAPGGPGVFGFEAEPNIGPAQINALGAEAAMSNFDILTEP
ncbi:hypothetical protein [Streptomyces rimosus]|nr:hypothetical protein [Streptomyces rimosus]